MNPTRIAALALCLALAACGDKPAKPIDIAKVLPNLPLPPRSSFVSRSAGADAAQVVMRTPAAPELVVAYYRDVFKRGPWKLVNEAKDAQGATVLLANQDGPPLWVRVRPSGDGTGSLIELSGAVVAQADSAAAKPAS
jgi:hypothetical protein